MRRPSRCGRCGKLDSHDSLLQTIERTIEYLERGRAADYIEQRKEFLALGRRHLAQAEQLLAALKRELDEPEREAASIQLSKPSFRVVGDMARDRLGVIERLLAQLLVDEASVELWLGFCRSLLRPAKLDRAAALAFLEGLEADAHRWPARAQHQRAKIVNALLEQLSATRQALSAPAPAPNIEAPPKRARVLRS